MVEKRFGKLGMPDIERFENYLPTAFNSELTLLQKVNKIIFDLMEANKLTNEMVDYLNEFMETFDEKLFGTISDVLNVWLADGRLGEVVEEAIFNLETFKVEMRQLLEDYKNETDESIVTLANKLTKQLDDFVINIDTKIDDFEKVKDDTGYFHKIKEIKNITDPINFKTQDYYNLYNTLLSDSRFKRRDLGKDQSGAHEIRLYSFEPTSFNKTIFVVCALHGWEHYGTYIMYNVFNLLKESKDLSNAYRDLANTRIICIPVANPWGLNYEGAEEIRRGNSRSVDLNRNFDYNWENNSNYNNLSKGEYPFSEAETQIIRNVMEEYLITSYLDLHSFRNLETEDRDYLFYGNPETENNTKILINWLKSVYPETNISHLLTENDSSSNNYANRVRNIPSVNIEVIRDRYNPRSEDIRRWVEVLLNFLSLQSQSYFRSDYNLNQSKFLEKEVFVEESYQTISNAWTSVRDLKTTYKATVDGLIIVSGFVTVNVTTPDTVVTFKPSISQKDYYTPKSKEAVNRAFLKLGVGSHYIPFQTMFPCRKGFGDVIFDFEMIAENGSIEVRRKDVQVSYLSSDFGYVSMGQHNKVVEW